MGITTPTPIQRLAIQPVLDGRDVIAKAETGTGKTLAFGAPMMSKIDPARASVLGLVLCPTRELAEQGQKVLEILGKPRGIKVALVVGGEPLEPQVNALKSGAQVVVGTPGRILDLYKQRFLSFPWTEFAILDEADVMLEIGFIDDVKMILSYMPDERQTLLFSATFPPELLKLAREYTKNPVEVATASGVSTVTNIAQSWIKVDDDERPLALIRLIEQSAADDVFLVFCDRRTEVDRLMRRLERLPFSIKALHGGYDQAARFRVMSAFRTGEVKVLVATDVASRGLDVVHVTTVLNYSSPQDITDYTHRIGRTGRAGRKGRAITLVGGMDMRRWGPIQREATWDIPLVEAPGSSRAPMRRDDREDRPQRSQRAPDSRIERAPAERAPRNESTDRPHRGQRADRPARDAAHAPRTDARPADTRRAETRHADAPRRDEPRRWPADEEAPRRDAPRRMRPDDPIDHPPARSTPTFERPTRWPEDSDAHDRAVRHPDVRPQRESPRGGRNAQPRSSTHTDAGARSSAPREQRPREPRAALDARSGSGPRHEHRSGAGRDAHDRQSQKRTTEGHGEHGRRGAHEHTERPRAEGRRSDRPAAETRSTESRQPARAPSRPPANASGAPRPASASRHPTRGRSDRSKPSEAQLEERPPGTFERPLSGGLLGHAARRPTSAKPANSDSQRRPRGDHRR